MNTIIRHLSEPPAPLPDGPLKEPVMKMLSKSPGDRFPSVEAAWRALAG